MARRTIHKAAAQDLARAGFTPIAPAEDGELLANLLKQQATAAVRYPPSERDIRALQRKPTVRTLKGDVSVEIPESEDEEQPNASSAPPDQPPADVRESHHIQALLATIGAKMGFKIWMPKGDQSRLISEVPPNLRDTLLEKLPLNYDDATLRTIEQIDVIWLKGRSIARAFEVEHSTAVYSGLLRMADLVALQPDINIALHIVALEERRKKVLRELRRPVFSLLETGPLSERCTFLPYDAIRELAENPHLDHMSDSILEEYEECEKPEEF